MTADSIVPDTYNPQSLNRYLYCLNNPLLYIDPDGHREILEGDPARGDDFSVTPREDSKSGFEIVTGGDRYRNRTEKAVANAFYTGNTRYLNGVTSNHYGFLEKTVVIIGYEFGVIPESEFWSEVIKGISAAGGGVYAGTSKSVGQNTSSSPALKGNPYSPGEVSKRQSKLRGKLGLNKDPNTPIPDQSPGKNIKDGIHTSRGKTRHITGERNVSSKEEHSRVAKGTGGQGSRN